MKWPPYTTQGISDLIINIFVPREKHQIDPMCLPITQILYVFFLTLSVRREQAKKATDMHPTMTAEAERMLHKLRVSLVPSRKKSQMFWVVIPKEGGASGLHGP